MSWQTMMFVGIGAVVMFIIALICKNNFGIGVVKTALLTLCLTFSGVASVVLMFFVENGYFGGVSFFGAVFFVPLFLLPFSFLLKIPYLKYLELSAPMVSGMLAVMKINCYVAGCCRGRVLRHTPEGDITRFPSQLAELFVAAVIAVVLIVCIKKAVLPGRIYPFFMILYGASRFVMNFLRETEEFIWGMGIGSLWAIVSFLIGTLWIILVFVQKKRKKV